ncbi:hypothetical protein Mapa_000952 [Marchantia paleacea]|nr:hypothetical protein Mapa_000952 [Marchantia paleacea]
MKLKIFNIYTAEIDATLTHFHLRFYLQIQSERYTIFEFRSKSCPELAHKVVGKTRQRAQQTSA